MEGVSKTYRIKSIDFVRGLVIVIMAIDHVRDLLHINSFSQDPLDLKTTTPLLFMTRWITHLCAPTFVFLAGTSAYLMSLQQNDLNKTRKFLLTRGLWLILLELTVINLGVWSDFKFRTFLLQVIFAIGSGFCLLALFLKLRIRTLGVLALVIIFSHDLLTGLKIENNQTLEFIRTLFFDRGFFKISEDRGIMVAYAAIPWFGIMLLGFVFGKVFTQSDQQRKKSLLLAGLTTLGLFLLLRSVNIYGDSRHWSVQDSFLYSVFSFIDVSKYPPSLLYTCITLGIMFFALRLADAEDNVFVNFFRTFGKVPMFFYILHWYIVHVSMYIMVFMQGYSGSDIPLGIMQFGRPEGAGMSLGFVYLYWFFLIVCMYPLCRWYGNYKDSHPSKVWLKYL
ncbi:MAG: DUF1624 domain-containing protein [Bacteroidia bacterium]|nr:DUF1624 domain-containing protein [Bacteroidia bacterium]